jgi:hypothetical protein
VSGQPGRYQRSAPGMIGAMLILLAVVVGFVLLRDLNRAEPESPVRAIDYQRTVDFASEQADFDILAPESLPTGWKATTAGFTPDPGDWHLGVLTDRGRYVGIEQSTRSARSMLETYVDPSPTRAGAVTIDGARWQKWTDPGGDIALVRTRGEVTTLVVGTAEQDVLVDYIASLR